MKRKQSELPAFRFLYWNYTSLEMDEIDEKERVKTIRAQNIKWACRKFMNTRPELLHRIDYEVWEASTDTLINISEMEGVSEFI